MAKSARKSAPETRTRPAAAPVPVADEQEPRSEAVQKLGTGRAGARAAEARAAFVADAGMSIDPEELGRQFLRDATEQDNFEASLEDTNEIETFAVAASFAEASLREALQDEASFAASEALTHSAYADAAVEPRTSEIDLLSNVVREGSLFDQPDEAGGVRAPAIIADEVAQHILAMSDDDDDDEDDESGLTTDEEGGRSR